MRYGRRRAFRGRRLGYPTLVGGPVAPFGRPMYPIPYRPKRKYPGDGGNGLSGASMRMGRRVRARTITRTKTKQQQRIGRTVKVGDNSSLSSTYFGSNRIPPFLSSLRNKLMAPSTIEGYTSNSLLATTGKQFVQSFGIIDVGHLSSIKTALIGSTNKSIRVLLRSGKEIYQFRNQTNTNARMAIYDIYTYRDSQNPSIDNPTEAWSKGVVDLTSINHHLNPGQTPFKSAEFRNYFKVYKVTYVNLEPGQQHEHIIHHRWNRIVDTTRFDNSTSETFAGLTRFCMVTAYGHLVHDTNDSTSVSTAPITIDYSRFIQFSWSSIAPVSTNLTISSLLPVSIADPDQMGETGDADVNVNSA